MVRNIGNNWNFDNTDEWLPAPRFGGGLDLSPYGEPLCYSGAWQESLAAAEPAGEPAQRFVYDAYRRLMAPMVADWDKLVADLLSYPGAAFFLLMKKNGEANQPARGRGAPMQRSVKRATPGEN